MTAPVRHTWQSVRDTLRQRIHAREWPPGTIIPTEADLAQDFGCARATVNRALRALADTGLVDRRRKAGTRVATQPTARATLDIPVIRKEITEKGQSYGYALLTCAQTPPPPAIAAAMGVPIQTDMLHLTALHLADGTPYVIEDRWINLAAVPNAVDADFTQVSANEWLLDNAAYTHGDIAFLAAPADAEAAQILQLPQNAALFVIDRTTWNNATAITNVRLSYAPGYRLTTRM